MTMNMTIVMTMNIYINERNTVSLNAEDNKSGLINRLLKEYYSKPNCKCPAGPIPHSHLEDDGKSHNIKPYKVKYKVTADHAKGKSKSIVTQYNPKDKNEFTDMVDLDISPKKNSDLPNGKEITDIPTEFDL